MADGNNKEKKRDRETKVMFGVLLLFGFISLFAGIAGIGERIKNPVKGAGGRVDQEQGEDINFAGPGGEAEIGGQADDWNQEPGGLDAHSSKVP